VVTVGDQSHHVRQSEPAQIVVNRHSICGSKPFAKIRDVKTDRACHSRIGHAFSRVRHEPLCGCVDRRWMGAMKGPKILRRPQQEHLLGRPLAPATTVPNPMEKKFISERAARHRAGMRTSMCSDCPQNANVE
jgi:hypothetical protein